MTMRITAAAQRLGVSPRMLRYREAIGLLPAAPPAGHRTYTEADLAAVALARVMASLLFGVRALDAPAYAVALTTLGAVALAACAVPALRATRVDPLVALREE